MSDGDVVVKVLPRLRTPCNDNTSVKGYNYTTQLQYLNELFLICHVG